MDLKILVLFKNIDGGTGTYLESLLEVERQFKKENAEIKVLVLDYPRHKKITNYNISYCPDRKAHSGEYKFSNIIRIVKQIIWFQKEVGIFSPDVVISEDLHSVFISEIVKLVWKKSYRTINIIYNNIQKVIETKIPLFFRRIAVLVFSKLLNKSFLVATISNGLSNSLCNYFKLKHEPLILHTALPRSLRRQRNPGRKPGNIVICIARFDPQKDHICLLKAFREVLPSVPGAKLWLVGDGPLKSDLVAAVSALGIKKSVKFFGWIQNPNKYLSRSSVLVLPTKWEGFGLVLLESMSNGVPVIASDCDFGPSEILGKGKYGILTPVGDSEYLAKSIKDLLLDSKKLNHYAKLGYLRSKFYSGNKSSALYRKIIISAALGKSF